MANGWHVVPGAQRFSERYMPSGQFEPTAEIQIKADDGAYYTIILPMGQYTRDNVQAAGDEWYARHQAVNQIGNG